MKIITKVFFLLLATELPVGGQHEDGSPWTHGTVVGNGAEDHNRRLYKNRVIIRTYQDEDTVTCETNTNMSRRFPA